MSSSVAFLPDDPRAQFVDQKGRPVDVPSIGAPIADTHAHLDMLEDPALALARAALVGVEFVATVCDVTEDAWRTFAELESWKANAAEILHEWGSTLAPPDVRIVVGAHPHNAKDYLASDEARLELERLAADPMVCAIGEVGLDYHYDLSPREQQRDAYRLHLDLANRHGLPVVIHLREAHEDGAAILREIGVPSAGAILHCFNLGADQAAPFLELGCHVSFAGPATFKKADDVREAASRIPLGRILTETDCPFMAPEPFRGMKCEPAFTLWTAARIGQVRSEQPEVFAQGAYLAARVLLDNERS